MPGLSFLIFYISDQPAPVRFPSLLLAAIVVIAPRAVTAQTLDKDYLLAVRTGVTCHSSPDPEAPAAQRYHVGDVIGSPKSARGPGHSLWYFDSWRVMGISPACWIEARWTVPYDRAKPEKAYLAIADSLLARKGAVPFDDYVDVLNLLETARSEQPAIAPGILGRGDASLAEQYPRLRYRRLLIVERAVAHLSTWSIADHPLTRAWIAAHSDVLRFFEPDAGWYVPATAYWSLYDAHRTEGWADSVAWTAAQHLGPGDECMTECYLSMLASGPEEYWTRLPHGAHVRDALVLADKLASTALEMAPDEVPPRSEIEAIRKSLSNVAAPEKAKLIDLLDRIERTPKRPD